MSEPHDIAGASFRRPPTTIEELAEHVGVDPTELEPLLDEALRDGGVEEAEDDTADAREFDDDEEYEYVSPHRYFHVACFLQAADGTLAERVRTAAACERDRLGTPLMRRAQDAPSDELPLWGIAAKHGLDLDRLLRTFASYGELHLACPDCGSVELRQAQADQIDGRLYFHWLQSAFESAETTERSIEYIPGDVGPDEDPPEYGIECAACGRMHHGSGALVVAKAAQPPA